MISRREDQRFRTGWVPPGKSLADYPRRINLGSGGDYRPGWTNVDKYAPKADARWDVFRPPYPIPDGSVDFVFAEQILEHVPHQIGDRDGLLVILEELHRILRPGGLLSIGVPYAYSHNDTNDVTHYRHFVDSSLDFLDPARWPDHPVSYQTAARFRFRKATVRRAIRFGDAFDSGYHCLKYLGFDPNIGRPVALQFVLERP